MKKIISTYAEQAHVDGKFSEESNMCTVALNPGHHVFFYEIGPITKHLIKTDKVMCKEFTDEQWKKLKEAEETKEKIRIIRHDKAKKAASMRKANEALKAQADTVKSEESSKDVIGIVEDIPKKKKNS